MRDVGEGRSRVREEQSKENEGGKSDRRECWKIGGMRGGGRGRN